MTSSLSAALPNTTTHTNTGKGGESEGRERLILSSSKTPALLGREVSSALSQANNIENCCFIQHEKNGVLKSKTHPDHFSDDSPYSSNLSKNVERHNFSFFPSTNRSISQSPRDPPSVALAFHHACSQVPDLLNDSNSPLTLTTTDDDVSPHDDIDGDAPITPLTTLTTASSSLSVAAEGAAGAVLLSDFSSSSDSSVPAEEYCPSFLLSERSEAYSPMTSNTLSHHSSRSVKITVQQAKPLDLSECVTSSEPSPPQISSSYSLTLTDCSPGPSLECPCTTIPEPNTALSLLSKCSKELSPSSGVSPASSPSIAIHYPQDKGLVASSTPSFSRASSIDESAIKLHKSLLSSRVRGAEKSDAPAIQSHFIPHFGVSQTHSPSAIPSTHSFNIDRRSGVASAVKTSSTSQTSFNESPPIFFLPEAPSLSILSSSHSSLNGPPPSIQSPPPCHLPPRPPAQPSTPDHTRQSPSLSCPADPLEFTTSRKPTKRLECSSFRNHEERGGTVLDRIDGRENTQQENNRSYHDPQQRSILSEDVGRSFKGYHHRDEEYKNTRITATKSVSNTSQGDSLLCSGGLASAISPSSLLPASSLPLPSGSFLIAHPSNLTRSMKDMFSPFPCLSSSPFPSRVAVSKLRKADRDLYCSGQEISSQFPDENRSVYFGCSDPSENRRDIPLRRAISRPSYSAFSFPLPPSSLSYTSSSVPNVDERRSSTVGGPTIIESSSSLSPCLLSRRKMDELREFKSSPWKVTEANSISVWKASGKMEKIIPDSSTIDPSTTKIIASTENTTSLNPSRVGDYNVDIVNPGLSEVYQDHVFFNHQHDSSPMTALTPMPLHNSEIRGFESAIERSAQKPFFNALLISGAPSASGIDSSPTKIENKIVDATSDHENKSKCLEEYGSCRTISVRISPQNENIHRLNSKTPEFPMYPRQDFMIPESSPVVHQNGMIGGMSLPRKSMGASENYYLCPSQSQTASSAPSLLSASHPSPLSAQFLSPPHSQNQNNTTCTKLKAINNEINDVQKSISYPLQDRFPLSQGLVTSLFKHTSIAPKDNTTNLLSHNSASVVLPHQIQLTHLQDGLPSASYGWTGYGYDVKDGENAQNSFDEGCRVKNSFDTGNLSDISRMMLMNGILASDGGMRNIACGTEISGGMSNNMSLDAGGWYGGVLDNSVAGIKEDHPFRDHLGCTTDAAACGASRIDGFQPSSSSDLFSAVQQSPDAKASGACIRKPHIDRKISDVDSNGGRDKNNLNLHEKGCGEGSPFPLISEKGDRFLLEFSVVKTPERRNEKMDWNNALGASRACLDTVGDVLNGKEGSSSSECKAAPLGVERNGEDGNPISVSLRIRANGEQRSICCLRRGKKKVVATKASLDVSPVASSDMLLPTSSCDISPSFFSPQPPSSSLLSSSTSSSLSSTPSTSTSASASSGSTASSEPLSKSSSTSSSSSSSCQLIYGAKIEVRESSATNQDKNNKSGDDGGNECEEMEKEKRDGKKSEVASSEESSGMVLRDKNSSFVGKSSIPESLEAEGVMTSIKWWWNRLMVSHDKLRGTDSDTNYDQIEKCRPSLRKSSAPSSTTLSTSLKSPSTTPISLQTPPLCILPQIESSLLRSNKESFVEGKAGKRGLGKMTIDSGRKDMIESHNTKLVIQENRDEKKVNFRQLSSKIVASRLDLEESLAKRKIENYQDDGKSNGKARFTEALESSKTAGVDSDVTLRNSHKKATTTRDELNRTLLTGRIDNCLLLPQLDVSDVSHETLTFINRSHIKLDLHRITNLSSQSLMRKISECGVCFGEFRLGVPGFRLENILIPLAEAPERTLATTSAEEVEVARSKSMPQARTSSTLPSSHGSQSTVSHPKVVFIYFILTTHSVNDTSSTSHPSFIVLPIPIASLCSSSSASTSLKKIDKCWVSLPQPSSSFIRSLYPSATEIEKMEKDFLRRCEEGNLQPDKQCLQLSLELRTDGVLMIPQRRAAMNVPQACPLAAFVTSDDQNLHCTADCGIRPDCWKMLYIGRAGDLIDTQIADLINHSHFVSTTPSPLFEISKEVEKGASDAFNEISSQTYMIDHANVKAFQDEKSHGGNYIIDGRKCVIARGRYGLLEVYEGCARQPFLDYVSGSQNNIDWLPHNVSSPLQLIDKKILPPLHFTQIPWESQVDRRKAMELACHRAALREEVSRTVLMSKGIIPPPSNLFHRYRNPVVLKMSPDTQQNSEVTYSWGACFTNTRLVDKRRVEIGAGAAGLPTLASSPGKARKSDPTGCMTTYTSTGSEGTYVDPDGYRGEIGGTHTSGVENHVECGSMTVGSSMIINGRAANTSHVGEGRRGCVAQAERLSSLEQSHGNSHQAREKKQPCVQQRKVSQGRVCGGESRPEIAIAEIALRENTSISVPSTQSLEDATTDTSTLSHGTTSAFASTTTTNVATGALGGGDTFLKGERGVEIDGGIASVGNGCRRALRQPATTSAGDKSKVDEGECGETTLKWGVSGDARRPVRVSTGDDQLDTDQLDNNQLDTNQLDTNQLDTNQLDTNQLGTNQLGTNQMDTNQSGMNQVGTNQVGTNQVGTNQVGTNQVGTNQLDTNQLDTNRVDTDSSVGWGLRGGNASHRLGESARIAAEGGHFVSRNGAVADGAARNGAASATAGANSDPAAPKLPSGVADPPVRGRVWSAEPSPLFNPLVRRQTPMGRRENSFLANEHHVGGVRHNQVQQFLVENSNPDHNQVNYYDANKPSNSYLAASNACEKVDGFQLVADQNLLFIRQMHDQNVTSSPGHPSTPMTMPINVATEFPPQIYRQFGDFDFSQASPSVAHLGDSYWHDVPDHSVAFKYM